MARALRRTKLESCIGRSGVALNQSIRFCAQHYYYYYYYSSYYYYYYYYYCYYYYY